MSVNALGNSSKAGLGTAATGQGVNANYPTGMGWLAVISNAAGDVTYQALEGLLISQLAHGIFAQGSVAATLQFTLCNPAEALSLDPNVQSGVLWSPATTLVPNAITNLPVLFTAVKITFPTPGVVYFGVR